MKNITLTLLCCSALLSACDDAGDTAKQASEKATGGLDNALESAKESASGAMDAARETASDAMAAGKGLKDTASESAAAAVDSVKESAGGAIDAARDMSSAAVEKSTTVIASIAADVSRQGQDVYKKACHACHGTGVAGAPKLGDKAAWSTRIAQGHDVLTQHVIKGYKGDTGYMPPKGGATYLSDEEVSAAVKYMTAEAQ